MQEQKSVTHKYNFIDLFEGAGGLSEGFIQAGFSPIAHIEMNPFAAQTLETRSAYYYLKSKRKLSLYYDYLAGAISRQQLMESVPKDVLESVICETMSDETLPGIFSSIDNMYFWHRSQSLIRPQRLRRRFYPK